MCSAMLHINDLSYRIEGRPIFEGATAGIPTGHKVGLVGRNGAGKTTLLKALLADAPSPLLSAYGLFRDPAAQAPNTGVTAYDVAARMKYKGKSLEDAASETVARLTEIGGEGGLIAVDAEGNVVLPFNSEGMYRGWRTDEYLEVEIYRE